MRERQDSYKHTIGTIAEMRLVAELLSRGFKVAKPIVDDGVDLVVNYKLCLQIKSMSKATSFNSYQFKIRNEWKTSKGSIDLAPEVDIIALYAIDIDGWWLIPREEVEGVTTICITPEYVKNIYNRWRDAWFLLDERG